MYSLQIFPLARNACVGCACDRTRQRSLRSVHGFVEKGTISFLDLEFRPSKNYSCFRLPGPHQNTSLESTTQQGFVKWNFFENYYDKCLIRSLISAASWSDESAKAKGTFGCKILISDQSWKYLSRLFLVEINYCTFTGKLAFYVVKYAYPRNSTIVA